MATETATQAEPQVAGVQATVSPVPIPELLTMLEAGVHFGHERNKRNPKMMPYIYTQRSRVAIFDLEKTQAALRAAVDFICRIAGTASNYILFVGTSRQARAVMRKYAELTHQPFVTKRWLGGTLTNFSTILKSIEKLEQLKSAQGTAEFEKLTKKEKAVHRKEIEHLEGVLEGIKGLRVLPAALVVASAHDEKIAIREAHRMHIPTVAIADTNADPDTIDYPIPANDDAVRSIDLLIGTIAQAIEATRIKT